MPPKFDKNTDEIVDDGKVGNHPSAQVQAAMTRGDRDKAKKKALSAAPTGKDESTGIEYLKGRTNVPQCHVCQHPFRDWIEMMLIRGATYKGLQDRVPPAQGQNKLDRRSIANHYKNHMDLQDAAMRAILEREASLQSQDFEEGVEGAITKRGVLEVLMHKGYQDVIDGVTTVEVRDLVQLVKVIGEMDSHSGQVGLDEARAQVQIFIQAIKTVCSLEQQSDIAAEVKKLRSRESIDTRFEEVMNTPLPQTIELVEALEPPEATVVE